MTVKRVRKEMDMGQKPYNQPSNDAPMPPNNVGPEIPDHTHPEYDQLLVKMQEIESKLGNMQMGGVNQESLDEGKPEHDKGKPTGGQEPLKDTQGNWEPKKIESLIKKMVKEELKGTTDRKTGKDLKKSGPEQTDNIPQSTQPSNGEAPSGGKFDSDDKLNDKSGDDAVNKTSKPKSDYEKMPVQKNKLNRAKRIIERAKRLMSEANGSDPTKPNPGDVEKEPKKMDGQVPNKSPTGGTEKFDEEDEEKKMEEKLSSIYSQIKKEVMSENRLGSKRESLVGMTSLSSEQTRAAHENFVTSKERVTNSVKEYLSKAGHRKALAHIGAY